MDAEVFYTSGLWTGGTRTHSWGNLKLWLKRWSKNQCFGRDESSQELIGQSFKLVDVLINKGMTFEEMEPIPEIWKETANAKYSGFHWA